jgi:hypothetical protein
VRRCKVSTRVDLALALCYAGTSASAFSLVARLASPLPPRPPPPSPLVPLVPLLVHRHSSPLSPRLKSCRRFAVRPHSLVDATKAHPSNPVRPCHACRARRLASRAPARSATCFVGHVVAYGFIHFSFICFPLSCFRLSLVALFFSFPFIALAIRLLELPPFSTSHPLSRIDYHSFSAFNLDTERFSHMTPRGLSPAGLSLSPFPFSLPHLLLTPSA